MNERLSIGEVGVDLELWVHAHGNDVDLIMEASRNNNYFLGIIWSCTCDFGLCNRGSNQDFLLWSPFSDKLKCLPSAIQYTYPNSNMVYLRVLPLVPREYQITELLPMNIHLVLLLTDFRFSPGFWVISHSRTPIRETIPHSDSTNLSNFRCLRV